MYVCVYKYIYIYTYVQSHVHMFVTWNIMTSSSTQLCMGLVAFRTKKRWTEWCGTPSCGLRIIRNSEVEKNGCRFGWITLIREEKIEYSIRAGKIFQVLDSGLMTKIESDSGGKSPVYFHQGWIFTLRSKAYPFSFFMQLEASYLHQGKQHKRRIFKGWL